MGLKRSDPLVKMSSSPRDFHPQALPEPCKILSSHTAPDVRQFPFIAANGRRAWGLPGATVRTSPLAPLVRWTNRKGRQDLEKSKLVIKRHA
jgi:hypothetical protein